MRAVIECIGVALVIAVMLLVNGGLQRKVNQLENKVESSADEIERLVKHISVTDRDLYTFRDSTQPIKPQAKGAKK